MERKPLNVVLHVVQPEYIDRLGTCLAFITLAVFFLAFAALVVFIGLAGGFLLFL